MIIKKIIFLLTLLGTINIHATSQVYYTKNGNASFFSKTMLQDIKADNNQMISVLNIQTGEIQFSLLNNAFRFPKAKMEEDFNENYIESAKYPRSTFKGNITNLSEINFAKDGTYPVKVKGDLMIHGVEKSIATAGTITVTNGNISAASSFNILVKDYKINIPTIVNNKVAENIKIDITCNYQKK